MHRYNMAHHKAADEVFPAAVRSQTPVIAFTATRWGTLLESRHRRERRPAVSGRLLPVLFHAQPAVHVVLTAPKTVAELNENLAALKSPPLTDDARRHWEQFGDIIYKRGGRQFSDFESRWP